MKRAFLALIAVIGLVIFVSYNQLGGLIETGVEEYGPDILKVDVGLDDVKVNLLSGEIEMGSFTIGQPEGFGDGVMTSLDGFAMKLEPASLLSDHVIVDSIVVDSPTFDVRIKEGGLTNIKALQDGLNLPAASAGAAAEESAITMTIRSLAVKSPRLAVKSDALISIDDNVSLADFTLTDLGTDEEGLAPSEIARHIMDTLQPQIAQALVKIGAGKKVRELAAGARSKLESGVQGALQKLDEKVGDKVGNVVEESGLKEAAGGLLGKLTGKKKKKDDEEGSN